MTSLNDRLVALARDVAVGQGVQKRMQLVAFELVKEYDQQTHQEGMQRIWRCSQCGKWSHAIKKPTSHQRYVLAEPEDESIVIRFEAGYSGYDGEGPPDSWWIRCGPFDAYRVEPVQL